MTSGMVQHEIWAWGGIICSCVGRKQITTMIPLLVFWPIWGERNKRAFQGVGSSGDSFRDSWFYSLHFCYSRRVQSDTFCLLEMLEIIVLCA